GHQLAGDAVVDVVVASLRGVVDLHPGQPHREVVDHVVPAQLAVGDEIDAGDLLVLDRRLDRHVVDLVEVMAADATLEEVVLHALEPAGHGVTADDGGGKQWFTHDVTPSPSPFQGEGRGEGAGAVESPSPWPSPPRGALPMKASQPATSWAGDDFAQKTGSMPNSYIS